MNKTGATIGVIIVLVLIAHVISFIPHASSSEEAAVRDTVTNFGNDLKNVSLLAPTDQVTQAMQDNYAAYVAPDLLSAWEAAPQKAPGRLTSSPWPDSIIIGSIQKQLDGSYSVTGSVNEITSTGAAGSYPVALSLQKLTGNWLITDFSGYPPSQVQQQQTP